jgi:hypothetical protein
MPRFHFHALIGTACFALTGVEAMADTPSRFSADAVALFNEISNSYDLNGKRVAGGKFDDEALAKLAKSDEKEVREVAELAPKLKMLNMLNREQGKKIQEAFKEQIDKWPGIIGGKVIEALGSPPKEKATIQDAAKLLEQLMGSDRKKIGAPQQAVNKAWAIACLGNGTGLSMRNTMRDLALKQGPKGADVKEPVTVVLETEGPLFGGINITNKTDKALHHCLLFTRLVADKEQLEKLNKEENLVGKFILPGLGFSKATVAGSVMAADLRFSFNMQDKGVMIYVPEIPAGGKVTTLVARFDYFTIGSEADISLWCDELAAEHQPASNFSEARAAAEKALKPPAKARPKK